MHLTLGFSPCPNDTFIFDALVHGRIDTEGLTFDVHLGDVEELNRLAFAGELDVTKLSYHAFGHLTENYALLHAGSALGRGVGPLLVRKKGADAGAEPLKNGPVAIPGRFTTANYLLGLAYPELTDLQEVLFSEIEDGVLSGAYAAGLLIHENRFTYRERGLERIADLGAYWEDKTGLPIPLGGIVIRRSLPLAVQQAFDRVLARSLRYAFDHPAASADYVAAHAQEMDPEVTRQHIALYVNDFSLDLGEEGLAAVQHFIEGGRTAGVLPPGISDYTVPLSAT